MVITQLKKVAGGYDVEVVFSAKNNRKCVFKGKKKSSRARMMKKKEFSVNHPRKNQFVDCAKNVVSDSYDVRSCVRRSDCEMHRYETKGTPVQCERVP